MATDEAVELQKEWRASILNKLESLDSGQKELKSDVNDIKVNFAKQNEIFASKSEVETLRKKVEDLSYFKAKTVGIYLGATGFLLALLKLLSIAGHPAI